MMSCSVFALRAEDTKLYIHFKDGSQIALNFADRTRITFNKYNALRITSKSLDGTLTKGIGEVHKITFDDAAGLDDITADTKGTIKPSQGNMFSLIGFKAGTPLTVTGLNGVVYISTTIDGPDSVDISLDGYASGYYIIAAGDVACKIAVY